MPSGRPVLACCRIIFSTAAGTGCPGVRSWPARASGDHGLVVRLLGSAGPCRARARAEGRGCRRRRAVGAGELPGMAADGAERRDEHGRPLGGPQPSGCPRFFRRSIFGFIFLRLSTPRCLPRRVSGTGIACAEHVVEARASGTTPAQAFYLAHRLLAIRPAAFRFLGSCGHQGMGKPRHNHRRVSGRVWPTTPPSTWPAPLAYR